MIRLSFLFLPLAFFLFACENKQAVPENASPDSQAKQIALSDSFSNYWYAGEAEITTYQLEQVRYGDIHTGHSTLIFVTEPFSKSKQVKLDNASAHPEDAVNVLKLNATRKFNTGIYPYSTMLSSFKPVENAATEHNIKTTFSAQEWCGHTFFQLNREKDKNYTYQGFSYFESRGDVEGDLENVLLEDELWNTIRLQPELLPTGKVSMLPGLVFLRLRHHPIKAYSAIAQLKKMENGKMNFTLEYEDVERTLSIIFDEEFPYIIRSWEETTKTGFGDNTQTLTTKASLMKQIKSPYWKQNQKNDRSLRAKLNLPENYQ